MMSAPARAWLSDCAHSRCTVSSLTISSPCHHAVVAVAGVGVERGIRHQADMRHLGLDRAQRAAHEIVGVERLAAARVLLRGVRHREEAQRRDAGLGRLDRRAHRLVDGQPLDAGHRRHRDALALALDEEERPDQVVGGDDVLAHQAPLPFRAAVAARAMDEAERGVGVGAQAGGHRRAPALFRSRLTPLDVQRLGRPADLRWERPRGDASASKRLCLLADPRSGYKAARRSPVKQRLSSHGCSRRGRLARQGL